ncbi:hypothetical protein [Cryobacterium sp. PH31-O1]|uniref:hypothetical protein n=1 Tax=Cryobacterium sp. PH31-O1 TaxID=3046306 RepID=UPI0024BAB829|nr:hypothetical protein [Cryobacterium sp. PH31-O1]MDJ0338266.1 hypothetical protein [Cryobacterium sp. PH31-O1]
MTFTVPASKASIRQNRFEFSIEGSAKKYSLPKMKFMPVGVIAKLQAVEAPNLLDVLNFLGTGPAATAAGTLDGEQLDVLFTAWQSESGVTLEK